MNKNPFNALALLKMWDIKAPFVGVFLFVFFITNIIIYPVFAEELQTVEGDPVAQTETIVGEEVIAPDVNVDPEITPPEEVQPEPILSPEQISRLEDLKGMLDRGEITNEEYEKAKEETINETRNEKNPFDPNINSTDPKNQTLGKFVDPTVSPLDGSLNYEYPIVVPSGRNGLSPDIKLSYNSNRDSQSSILGVGWSLNIPYIQRMNKGGSDRIYTEDNFFSSLDGELIPQGDGVYVPKIENGSFLKYKYVNNSWTVYDKKGTKYKFGITSNGRHDNPNDSSKVFSWMLEEIEDTNGNTISYTYYKDQGQIYPDTISYNQDGFYSVKFYRSNREKSITSYTPGFRTITTYRISSIKVLVDGLLVTKYSISSTDNLIKNILVSGYSGDQGLTLPPTQFRYPVDDGLSKWDTSSFNLPTDASGKVLTLDYSSGSSYGNKFIDLNGDGLLDVLRWKAGQSNGYVSPDLTSGNQVFLNTGSGFELAPNFLLPTSGWQVVVLDYKDPNGTYGNSIFDINNDGLPDVVRWAKGTTNGSNGLISGNIVFLNTGSSFEPASDFLFPTNAYGKVYTLDYNSTVYYGNSFRDVNGDGRPDIVRWMADQSNGYISPDLKSGNQVFLNKKDNTGFELDPDFLLPTTPSGKVLVLEFNESTGVYGNKFIDINADGLIDILRWRSGKPNGYTSNPLNTNGNQIFLNTGHGFSLDSDFLLPTDSSGSVVVLEFKKGSVWADNNYGNSFMDINGDNLLDVVRWRAGLSNGYNSIPYGNQVFLNNGRGFETTSDFLFPTDGNGLVLTLEYAYSNLPNGSSIYGNLFIDLDGDGLKDILRWTKGYQNGYTNPNRSSGNQIFLNTGKSFELKSNFLLPTDSSGLVLNIDREDGSSSGNSIIDIDGDKIPDVVRWRAGQPNGFTSLNSGNQILSNMIGRQEIKEISNSKGGKNKFIYRRVRGFTNSQNVGINAHLPENYESFVVVSHSTDDNNGKVGTSVYEYKSVGYYYAPPFERKFTGFDETIETKSDGSTIKTKYHQNNGSDYNENGDSYAKIGKLYEKLIKDEDGHWYSRMHIKYQEEDLGNNTISVLPFVELNQQYDGSSEHVDTAVEYQYDEYGNIAKQINYGKVNGTSYGEITDIDSDKKTIEYTYINDIANYIVGLPTNQTLKNNEGDKASETRFTYDIKGNLLTESNWISGTDYATTSYTYNSYGLPLTETNPLGKITSYIYDTHNLYPIKITNPLGHIANFTYDYAFGKVKQTTDPNGFVYENVYDGLGRLIQEKAPSQLTPYSLILKREYVYSDTIPNSSVKVLDYLDSKNNTEVYQYFDGFGRLIQERKEAEATNTFNVRDVFYNNQGQLQKESLRYTSIGSAKTIPTTTTSLYTNYTYDILGRVVSATNNIGTSSTSYNGWVNTTTDANDNSKNYYKDAYGNLVKVEEINNGNIYTTNYEWNTIGELTKITDALGNIRRFTYDSLGRRLTAEDLHAPLDLTFGIWTYVYDNAGNIIRSIGPDGKVVVYTYDSLGRKTVEDYLGTTGEDIAYLYDCLNNIGKLCSAFTSTGTNTHYTYNSNSAIASEKKIIDGVSYINSYTYNIAGNITNIVYPDGGEVKYVYNLAGLLDRVERKESGGVYSNVVSNFDYSPMDQIATITYPNFITTTNTYDVEKGYRLIRKLTYNPALIRTQDLNYTYDNVGNITKIVDASNTLSSKITNYTYDNLYRLISTNVTSTANNQNYTENITYDALGNILTKGQEVYTYGGIQGGDYANPHAVTKITAPTYSFDFLYDKNGNLIRKTSTTSAILTSEVNSNGYTTNAWYESSATGSQKLQYGPLPLLPYTLTGLYPGNTYQFRVVAQSEKGTTYGDWITFRTGGVLKPVVFSQVATPSTTSAKLKGSVSGSGESTTAWYESSKTGSQKLQLTQIENCTTATSLPTYTLSGLTKDTSYKMRVVSQNRHGITYGDWINFKTGGALYPSKKPIINSSIATPNTPLSTFNSMKYNWSYRNELLTVSGMSNNNTYVYDDAGSRVKATVGGVNMYYPSKLYSRESSSDKTKYIYAGNTLVATVRTKDSIVSPYYIHTDHLGSTNAVSSNTGISEILDYYSYGADRISTGSCDLKRKYIGQYCDNDTALAYLNARYYDGNRGRFVSQDPAFLKIGSSEFEEDYNIKLNYYLMNPQSLNSYSYANNNPLTWSDPGGEILPLVILGVWAVAEVGLSAYDGYNAYQTVNDPNATDFEKDIAVGGFVAGIVGPGAGYGTAGKGVIKAGNFISKNSRSLIQISKSKLQHVIDRHAWNSTEGVSTFLKGIDPVKLVNKASDVAGTAVKGSDRMIRVVTSKEAIGFDYMTKQTTNTYTVITKFLKNGKEKLITVYPGLPNP